MSASGSSSLSSTSSPSSLSSGASKSEVYALHEIRALLLRVAGIRCVFPEFYSETGGSNCRIMVERGYISSSGSDVPDVEELFCVIFGAKKKDRMQQDTTPNEANERGGMALRERLERLYGKNWSLCQLPPGQATADRLKVATKASALVRHPGITPVYGFVDHADAFLVLQEYAKHTLLSLSRFHVNTSISVPSFGRMEGDGAKDMRLRFVLYQLLQVMCFVHSQGLSLDGMHPSNIMIDDDLWVTVLPLLPAAGHGGAGALGDIPRPPGHRETLTAQWVRGRISNLDYLMAVNAAAGRSMVDSLYHPVLPWITDFSSAAPVEGRGLRNFKKTKFRLSKGDHQLTTSFAHSEPPHHISESLSELTYCIYLARVMPMQVLRRVVRNDFVPEHYPHSVARMYEWSPDECIPEFFCDVASFHSIHKEHGLSDIELPHFASTPEEFILFHRRLLESDMVSARLHYWIDLTFGCCLEGTLAEDNMNVPLRHKTSARERAAASPDLNKHPGFVVLFHSHHPTREVQLRGGTRAGTRAGVAGGASSASCGARRSMGGGGSGVDGLSGAGSKRRGSSSWMTDFSPALSEASGSWGTNVREELKLVMDTCTNMHMSRGGRASRRAGVVSDPKEIVTRMAPMPGDARERLDRVRNYVDVHKFHERYKTLLHPAYRPASPAGGEDEKETDSRVARPCWDEDFAEALTELRHITALDWCGDDASVRAAQSADLHALGCIISEFYCGTPLFDESDVQTAAATQTDYHCHYQTGDADGGGDGGADESRRLLNLIETRAGELPVPLRRFLALVVNGSGTARPTAREILANASLPDFDVLNNKGDDRWSRRESRAAEADATADAADGYCQGGYVNFEVGGGAGAGADDARDAGDFSPSTTGGDARVSAGAGARAAHLQYFCGSLFPDHFHIVYMCIGSLKRCTGAAARLTVAVELVPHLETLPLEGLGILLPHFLSAIATAPELPDARDPVPASSRHRAEHARQAAEWVDQFASLIDVLGSRLGTKATNTCIISTVMDYVASLRSVEMVTATIQSNIWQVVVMRAGPVPFLRSFLPTLLTYLMLGTLQNINAAARAEEEERGERLSGEASGGVAQQQSTSMDESASHGDRGSTGTDASQRTRSFSSPGREAMTDIDDGLGVSPVRHTRIETDILAPLWASGQGGDPGDWLLAMPREDTLVLQAAVARMLPTLAAPHLLGPGLCCRYVLPALLCLVGVPRLSIASPRAVPPTGSPEEDGDGARGGDVALAQSSTYDPQHMFTVPATVDLALTMGETVICEVVLKKVFESILPGIVRAFDENCSSGVVSKVSASGSIALLEVIFLLTSLLPALSAETVATHFLRPARHSTLSLPALLHRLPMHISPEYPDIPSSKAAACEVAHRQSRWQMVRIELCRLLVSSCMWAGSRPTFELVLPSVDVYFGAFVARYGHYSVDSKAFQDGIEVGAQLFTPLGQLVGEETMSIQVQHINPALELWLRSVGNGTPAESLPRTILPSESNSSKHCIPSKEPSKSMWKSTKSFVKSMLNSESKGDVKSRNSKTGGDSFQSPDTLTLESMRRHVETTAKKEPKGGQAPDSPERLGPAGGTPFRRERGDSFFDEDEAAEATAADDDDDNNNNDNTTTTNNATTRPRTESTGNVRVASIQQDYEGATNFMKLEVPSTAQRLSQPPQQHQHQQHQHQPTSPSTTTPTASTSGASADGEGEGEAGATDSASGSEKAGDTSPSPNPPLRRQPLFTPEADSRVAGSRMFPPTPPADSQDASTPPGALTSPQADAVGTAEGGAERVPPPTPSAYMARLLNRSPAPAAAASSAASHYSSSARRPSWARGEQIQSTGKHLRPSTVRSQLMAAMQAAAGTGGAAGRPSDEMELDKQLNSSVWMLSGRGRWLETGPGEAPLWNVLNALGGQAGRAGRQDGGGGDGAADDESDVLCGTDGFPLPFTTSSSNSFSNSNSNAAACDAKGNDYGPAPKSGSVRPRPVTVPGPTPNPNPAAYVSMTYPRIVCDVAGEAAGYSHLSMKEASSFYIGTQTRKESGSSITGGVSGSSGKHAITCLSTNENESLLLVATRDHKEVYQTSCPCRLVHRHRHRRAHTRI